MIIEVKFYFIDIEIETNYRSLNCNHTFKLNVPPL